MQFTSKLVTLTALALLLVGAVPAQASHQEVSIDPFVLSICGQQGIPFSGTAQGHSNQRLAVELDSTPVSVTLNDTFWTSGFITTSVGSHTLTAKIVSGSNVLESTQFAFTVVACPVPASPSSSSSGSSNTPGDVGPDPEQPTPVIAKGSVKGATITATKGTIANRLVPAVVERVFKGVFGRRITHQESLYWKNRARTNKRTEAVLKGAMEWHELRGRSIGK